MEEKDKEKRENKKIVAASEGNAVEKALKTFCCYLYVGKGVPYYKARPWNDDESYPISERLQCLDILVSNKETELVPIDKIKLAMDSKLIRRPETLMFALAMCARQKKSEKLRAAAYYFLAEHVKEWEYFTLFIKYTSILSKQEYLQPGSSKKSRIENVKGNNIIKGCNGCGRGWKNAVNKWYLTQSPTSLLHLVTHHKGAHGWKHKDILKLSHPETAGLEVEKQAILSYIFRGYEYAQANFGNLPEAKKMLDYIGATERFKRCEDPATVVEGIKTGKYTVDQVHPKALKSKEVWLALLDGMDVPTILKHIPRLNELGLLTKTSPATQLVVRALTDEQSLRWNKVLPSDVLSILNRYEKGQTLAYPYRGELDLDDRLTKMFPMIDISKLEDIVPPKPKQKNEWSKKRNATSSSGKANSNQTNAKSKADGDKPKPKGPSPVKEPDTRVLDALRTSLFITQTMDITESREGTYLVSVRLPGRRNNSICADAGLAIALPLLQRENIPDDAVTIIGYEPRWHCGSVAAITKDTNFDRALRLLFEMKSNRAEMLPMWCCDTATLALENRKNYDVIINVTNEPPRKDVLKVMNLYNRSVEKPGPTRLINVIINDAPLKLKGAEWNESLTINGWDPHVPWIIEAYIRGLF